MSKQITKIADITPDPHNANKGTAHGRSLLERSLRNLGAGRSILVDKNGLAIAGNKTLEVAAELNLRVKEIETDGHELIVVKRTDLDLLTDDKAKELAVADNRVAEVGLAWDGPMLADLGIDLQPWFSPAELAKIGAGAADVGDGPNPQLDKAEALRKQYGVELGQVWALGAHRLMCGDSTSKDQVDRLLQGAVPFLMVTDPPYGVEYDPEWRQEAADKGLSGFSPERMGAVANDDRVDWSESYQFFPGHVAYVWHAGRPTGQHQSRGAEASRVHGPPDPQPRRQGRRCL